MKLIYSSGCDFLILSFNRTDFMNFKFIELMIKVWCEKVNVTFRPKMQEKLQKIVLKMFIRYHSVFLNSFSLGGKF